MSLRVLLAIHGPADPRTAVYRTVSTNADYLRRAGHEADLVAADDLRWASHRLDPFFLPTALALRQLSRYDAVVFHSYLGYAFHALRGALDPRGRVATVTSFHGLEPLYFRALAGEATRAGQPLSARYRWVHGTMMPRVLRATCRASDAIFCLNSTEARYLVAEGWAARDRVKVVPNGVEAESFLECSARPPGCELLFVGQWLPAKGVAYLVQAFTSLAALADVRLTCVGTGAPGDAVLAAFPAHLRARVRVLPSVDREGLYDALRAADVFLFPTLSEGFSKALLEAMAAGLPIVTTPVGAAVDLLEDGRNALLVPPADSAAAAAAVRRYLEDGETARRHGAAARATAQRYRQEIVCQEWAASVAEVVERRSEERRHVRHGNRDVVH